MREQLLDNLLSEFLDDMPVIKRTLLEMADSVSISVGDESERFTLTIKYENDRVVN